MKTYLVTGETGFKGLNFIHYLTNKYTDIKIMNLDKQTYVRNLDNLKVIKVIKDNSHYDFIYGDICNKELVNNIFSN